MGPLLFVLFCLPYCAHSVSVTITEQDVKKIAGAYDDGLAKSVALDEDNGLVYVTGGDQIQVFSLATDGTLTLLKSQSKATYNFGQVRVCGNYISIAAKIGDDPATGRMLFYKVYSQSTGDDLALAAEIALDGSIGNQRHYDGCLKVIVPMVNSEFTDVWDDPGLIKIIEFSRANLNTATFTITTLDFDDLASQQATLVTEGALFDSSVTFQKGLEPVDVCINADESKAYVTLQSNNAVAVVDLATPVIESMSGLGLKYFADAPGFDPNNKNGIDISDAYPIYGAYGPSKISCFANGGVNYFVVANEGAFPYRNQKRLDRVTLDDSVEEFGNTRFQKQRFAGRLKIWDESPSNENGITQIIAAGGRSISVFNADTMTMINETGGVLEQQVAANYPGVFNSNSNFGEKTLAQQLDSRSDKRGPEPKVITSFSTCKDKYIVVIVGMEMPGGLAYFTLDTSDFDAGFEYQGMLMNIDTSDDSQSYGDLWTADKAYTLKVTDMVVNSDRNPLLIVSGGNGNTVEGYLLNIKCNG